MHWVSKVVGATVGAAERIADIQHEWHIARKDNYKSMISPNGKFFCLGQHGTHCAMLALTITMLL